MPEARDHHHSPGLIAFALGAVLGQAACVAGEGTPAAARAAEMRARCEAAGRAAEAPLEARLGEPGVSGSNVAGRGYHAAYRAALRACRARHRAGAPPAPTP